MHVSRAGAEDRSGRYRPVRDWRECCLGAGMNDYLANPVRRDALAAVIARYLPEGTRTHTAA